MKNPVGTFTALLFIPWVLLGACDSSAPVLGEDRAGDTGLTCAMPAEDLESSCKSDEDCVAVPAGNPCKPDCSAACRMAVVNVSVADRYVADFTAREPENKLPNMTCNCPCYVRPYCCADKCSISCGGCGGS